MDKKTYTSGGRGGQCIHCGETIAEHEGVPDLLCPTGGAAVAASRGSLVVVEKGGTAVHVGLWIETQGDVRLSAGLSRASARRLGLALLRLSKEKP